MFSFEIEDDVERQPQVPQSPLKDWRLKFQAGTITKNDFIDFFQTESRKYFEFEYVSEADSTRQSWAAIVSEIKRGRSTSRRLGYQGLIKCMFKEAGAKAGIIDVLLEFILGDNPQLILEKLRREGNTAAVCGKVFKNGEPTYSCRECGMDPTCVLCVNCFKQSAHRYHKYKMSTSGGGGCCDCGDEEAWKKDQYCEEHMRGKEAPPDNSIITDAIKERCEIAFRAIIMFCVNFFEIESNASLECLDGDGEGDEFFCTVLYNDESHTFDQVIQTLIKIVKCRQKDAMDIVASIDREGRAVVKCDTFYECCQLKEQIEKQSVTAAAATTNIRANQSLRVSVLHIKAISCQQFALQLLSWFQEFLMRHSSFRKIFATVVMDKRAPYNIGHILEYDVKLWKTARTCWHRLLISGMLMEYDNKMALAQEFSRHYATVVQDFIRDDHEHSFSIVSLSVQLFTVPSIAHYLIAHEGIFYKLLHTFYHESIEKYIQNKTLHFAKNMSSLGLFKRAAYILYDLRYILSFKPDVWTDELREGFLEGCKVLLRLLNVMQGMESVQRQTGQHMDYEPEWECAFNLHIKLASTISLVLEWCSSDREVLIKMYQMIMRCIVSNGFILSTSKTEEQSVAGNVASCIMYDVSARPVSIHLPLSRLFAGIYLHLGQHGLTFDNAVTFTKRSPEEIMEPILCTQTMIAQVHSGMWRRNGYSLLHQLYFYRNVRCRAEMLDRDIVGLQIGAALIESNQYLIHILNKFNLIEWVQHNYEATNTTNTTDDDFIRQLSMIDEFLELLIVIIGERHVPGVSNVTEDDRTRKEIIQLLCIKSYSHSELNRALPDSNNDTVLEDVIDMVADFKKPSKTDAKGVYELKEELYDDYNMYFYHYTKEEKSKSEETQRIRRKNKGELVCCPPPKLPKLTDGFLWIANLLQCDVMMHIISTVLQRALDLKAKSFTENHLQKVLHLIGYGLQEEESQNYPFLSFYERSQKYNILSSLENLSHSVRVEAHRDFILWTIQKFKGLQPKEKTSHMVSEDDGEEIASTSGITSLLPPALTAAEAERQEKEERSRLAAERRAKIMAQMQNAQKIFMKSNAEMFANTNAVAQANESAMEWQTLAAGEEGAVAFNSLACLGVDRRVQNSEEKNFKCILCFEDCTLTKDGPTLVYSMFVQKSKVLPPEAKYSASIHASSCGHVMHASCWQEYYNNEESKEQRRPHRNRSPYIPASVSTEFLCPYCRCLSNTVLPLTPPLSKYSCPNVIHAGDEIFPIDLWIDVMKNFGDELNKLRSENDPDMGYYYFPNWENIVESTNLNVDASEFEKIAQPIIKPEISSQWENFTQYYIKAVRQYTPTLFDLNESEGLLWMWHSCIYTIQALEVYLRAIEKPFKDEMSIRHKSCLSGLIRAGCLSASNIMPNDIKNLIIPIAEMFDTIFKQKSASVLEWNCFSMLASMIFMAPNMLFSHSPKRIITSGSLMDFYTLQLLFLANVVKAIVLFEAIEIEDEVELQQDENSMEVDKDDQEEQANPVEEADDTTASIQIDSQRKKLQANIAEFYKKYNLQARRKIYKTTVSSEGVDVNSHSPDSTTIALPECKYKTIEQLLECVKQESREFLRCCCLFFHFVTDVEFLDEFALPGGDTFANMCKYLGLNADIESYFDNEGPYATIIEMFGSHPDILYYDFSKDTKRNGNPFNVVPCTRPVPMLVTLPEDYSDLINSVSDFICPNNEREEMKTPTMCLICGSILCGQSYCCQPELEPTRNVGACTYHANYCGAEIGLFLRIRDCQIVYLGRNKGCFIQPPYLDEYGETDQGLRRGNPLRLCEARYRKIHLTWLGHGLHEEIARLNDNTSVAATQWHHM